MKTKIPVGGDAAILFQQLNYWLRTAPWRDARHLVACTWMMVGIVLSESIHPARWSSFRHFWCNTGTKY
ncbi:hypothetical protein [Deinococcus marmoris]|uniref:hypothetical protein n=1 Tax=Deinococcus marmoris TaxID=249408 RepID=UPI0011151D2C|nr:hypothetical protein [Deinococcus marmoris]